MIHSIRRDPCFAPALSLCTRAEMPPPPLSRPTKPPMIRVNINTQRFQRLCSAGSSRSLMRKRGAIQAIGASKKAPAKAPPASPNSAERNTNTKLKAQRLGRMGVKDHSACLAKRIRTGQMAKINRFRAKRMRAMLIEAVQDGESQ